MIPTVWREFGSLLAMAVGLLWWRMRVRRLERKRELLAKQETAAYARMDVQAPSDGDFKMLGRRVCRAVVGNSEFNQVAMLVRDSGEALTVVASAGMDDLTVGALQAWAGRINLQACPETGSFEIVLGPGMGGIRIRTLSGDAMRVGRATVAPFWSPGGGRVLGALVVCGRGSRSGRARVEILAMRLAGSMEVTALSERLAKAERLAGLGQLAGGVAHALNNPLTAVLGFAELIAEITEQPGVRKGAEMIRGEALRMRDTVQKLLNFARPGMLREEVLHLPDLLRELAAECEGKLRERGVRLVVETEGKVPQVRGNRDRMRQVMEHLLNNAAQAIAAASPGGEGHEIQMSVSHDRGVLQVIVSDTGTGFQEPGRVFDPHHTGQHVGEGSGLGLSICYGIVREHGGEISAFNLQPRGAAVMVELPVARDATPPPCLEKVGEVSVQ